MVNRGSKVVVDTNAVLSSIYEKSKNHIIVDCIFNGCFDLFVSNSILLEYEEKINTNFSSISSELFINALLILPTVKKINTYFDLRLIYPDYDDNKFVDCAFACNAEYLVTNDKDYNILKSKQFPKINLIKIEHFVDLLKQTFV